VGFFKLQPRRPDRAIHGYIYYRWTAWYVATARAVLERGRALGPIRTLLGRRLESTHHAKVVPTADARRVIELDRPIALHNSESVVPFPVARDIVLDEPRTIAIARCACRAVADDRGERDHDCGPIEQCLYVGDPVASFVIAKQGARRATAAEALAVIEAAASRGDVHTLWFKDAAAGRMYAICNCCPSCCLGFKARENGFSPLAGSGFVARVDAAACTACGACQRACPFGAVHVDQLAVVDAAACLGCGVCVEACPSEAIALAPAAEGPQPIPWERG
jgi:NAD-dependent dihydropyrimidine dehydrogenase PreA subunit